MRRFFSGAAHTVTDAGPFTIAHTDTNAHTDTDTNAYIDANAYADTCGFTVSQRAAWSDGGTMPCAGRVPNRVLRA